MAWLPATVLGGISLLLLSTLVAASAVDVRSDVDCPGAADVDRRLQPLLPRAAPDASSNASPERHVATIEAIAQPTGHTALHLRLRRSDASVIGDRAIPLAGDCQSMAEAVAVVIAAWETEGPSGLSAPENVRQVASAPLATPAPPNLHASVGAGAGAGLVGGVAVVGRVEAQLGPGGSYWRLRLAMMREGSRRVDLTPGGADWQHTMVEAGLVLQGAQGAWVGSVDVGPTVGWVTLQGVGFDDNQDSQSMEYGVQGGIRAGRRLGRWVLWAEARGNAWLRGQRALLTNSASAQVEIPRTDVSVGVGTSFLFFQ